MKAIRTLKKVLRFSWITHHMISGADLGGADASFLRDSTPCRPKGSPLWYFLRNPFLPTDPKIFEKAPSAPMYTNFEGEHASKKCNFLFKIFQKVPKNGFF